MSFLYFSYIFFSSLVVTGLLPSFLICQRVAGKSVKGFRERLGVVPAQKIRLLTGTPRIWIHAASLGEVRVAAAVVNALREKIPECSIIVSTMTESGRNLACKTFGRRVPVIYAPVDFPGSVRLSLSTVRPDIMVFLETEIWPVWVWQARRMGIRIVLINGRISLSSFRNYVRFRPFFQEVLESFSAFSMITESDAERLRAMGADPRKIEIHGNAKYDLLKKEPDRAVEGKYRRLLEINADDRVLVAGSTRNGEEALILDAYAVLQEEFPGLILVIAPRHIDRVPEIGALLQKRGFRYQLRTDFPGNSRTAGIIIVDTFGELFDIYSIGNIVFCGGSLVPLGGQNPLEPAFWGKAVFYGPYMQNFPDATAVLEAADAGVMVADARSLADRALWFLSRPLELDRIGKRARQAVIGQGGAAEKHAEEIKRTLG